MNYRKLLEQQVDEKSLLGTVLLLSIVAIAWGSLILPYALGLNNFDFTVIEGTTFIVVGFIGFLASLKWNRILSERKWYEAINKRHKDVR